MEFLRFNAVYPKGAVCLIRAEFICGITEDPPLMDGSPQSTIETIGGCRYNVRHSPSEVEVAIASTLLSLNR